MKLDEKDNIESTQEAVGEVEAALYLLPVGLSDVSAQRVLPDYNLHLFRSIKHFVVENVRTARRFLKKVSKDIDIDSLTFVELSEHTPDSEIPGMLKPLEKGEAVGVMSEAGCPAVADPGARLVEYAQLHNKKVMPLVGPSSILLALMGSGMNGQRFTFNGYLPVETKARENALRNLANTVLRNDVTQIFIETPYRNNRLLATMTSVLPSNMKLCVASDITGAQQNIKTKTISQWKKTEYNYDKIPTIFLLGN